MFGSFTFLVIDSHICVNGLRGRTSIFLVPLLEQKCVHTHDPQ